MRKANEADTRRTLIVAKLQSVGWDSLPHAISMNYSAIITIEPEKNYTEFGVRSFFKGIFLRRVVPGSAFSWQELYRLQAGDLIAIEVPVPPLPQLHAFDTLCEKFARLRAAQ